MSDPAHQLAKLTLKIASIASEGLGGAPTIRWEDVAAACAGMKAGPSLLVRLKWCKDGALTDDLVREALFEASALPEIQAMRRFKPGTIRTMILVGLHDVVSSHICLSCNGTKYVNTKPCEACCGTGKALMSDGKRADWAEISRSNWNDHWKPKYNAILQMLITWEDEGLRHIRRRLLGVA